MIVNDGVSRGEVIKLRFRRSEREVYRDGGTDLNLYTSYIPSWNMPINIDTPDTSHGRPASPVKVAAPLNIKGVNARAEDGLQPLRSALNSEQPSNMNAMVVTFDTSHGKPFTPVKAAAFLNILLVSVTDVVSHLLKSGLKVERGEREEPVHFDAKF